MIAEASIYSFRFVFFQKRIPMGNLFEVFGEVLVIEPQNLAVLADETRTARLPFTPRYILC
jgi:hypothetical protein